jgi:hypothetical protein
MVLVIAPIPSALHRPQLGKFLFPVAQYMGFNAAQIPDFTNGEVAFGRYGGESILH